MEEAINPYPNLNLGTTQPKRKKISPNFIAVAVLVIVIVVSFSILNKPKKTEEKKEVAVTQSPSPSPLPKIDKKTVKIQVQNGTGTPGQAGLVVKALTDAGYSTDNIKTGNAEKYDNSTTSITAKENYDEIVADIKDSLKSTFDKITVVSPNLGSTSEFDIVIMTGGKIFEEVTPTLTATVTPTLTSIPTPTP